MRQLLHCCIAALLPFQSCHCILDNCFLSVTDCQVLLQTTRNFQIIKEFFINRSHEMNWTAGKSRGFLLSLPRLQALACSLLAYAKTKTPRG
jgi:hypothetical protein